MTFTYPAVFTKKEEGDGYHAFFPDLEMCEADGADLEDAIENARDAAQNWISVEPVSYTHLVYYQPDRCSEESF